MRDFLANWSKADPDMKRKRFTEEQIIFRWDYNVVIQLLLEDSELVFHRLLRHILYPAFGFVDGGGGVDLVNQGLGIKGNVLFQVIAFGKVVLLLAGIHGYPAVEVAEFSVNAYLSSPNIYPKYFITYDSGSNIVYETVFKGCHLNRDQ